MDLVSYVFGFLDFWDLGFLGFVGNVLLALYIGFGDYLTFGSGYLCFGDLGDLEFFRIEDFWILIAVNPFQNM